MFILNYFIFSTSYTQYKNIKINHLLAIYSKILTAPEKPTMNDNSLYYKNGWPPHKVPVCRITSIFGDKFTKIIGKQISIFTHLVCKLIIANKRIKMHRSINNATPEAIECKFLPLIVIVQVCYFRQTSFWLKITVWSIGCWIILKFGKLYR